MGRKVSADATIRDIKRKTRKKYSAEEKIRIVLEGLRGKTSIADLCRREGIKTRCSEHTRLCELDNLSGNYELLADFQSWKIWRSLSFASVGILSSVSVPARRTVARI